MSPLIGAALPDVIERADQLVLNYVSKAADAAHGVLRADQRLDFARRLRAKIEAERRGSQNARQVAKVLARFGDPVALVEREARRLAEPASPAAPPSTLRFPAVVDDREPAAHRSYELPFGRLRRVAMSTANPMATGGRDARTIVKEHPRDIAAMAILVLAALLVPFGLPAVAIFQVPVLVWAAGAVAVLFSETWAVRDKALGIGAPLLGYTVGGVLVGGFRATEAGMTAFVTQFFDVSGVMFMIGTGLGVVWLAYRLLDLS